MNNFFITQNVDLLSVGLVTAMIGILGFVIFFQNRHSITHRTFLYFSLLTIFYGAVNYLNYQVTSPILVLWLLRVVLFLSVWHAFYLFQLFFVFPREQAIFSPYYKRILVPITALTSVLTLTPLVFSKIEQLITVGQVTNPVRGPGIVVFGAVILFLVLASIYMLFKKAFRAKGIEKYQFRSISVGTFITFSLIIVFNFVLPVVFNNLRFIPLAPVFFFPFILFTAYAIMRQGLLNVKVIATEILTFFLAFATLLEVILSQGVLALTFRFGVFTLVLVTGIFLIRSVRREVEQREELQKLTVQLEATNKKLEDLSRFKTQLLSLASHQIKSPLAAIKGFVSLLLEEAYGPLSDQAKETLNKVKNSTDSLVGLINSLLDLRKVEEGKMDYQFTRIELCALVKGVVEELNPLANEKKLKFEFQAPPAEIFVSADAQKLKQVIQNLVDNAIKYTLSGFVTVMLRSEGDTAVLEVADSGLGISPTLLPQIFEEFIRDERVKKEIKGTGLGLYIAKKIIEAHGGKVWVESEGEGKGSKFFASLRSIK